MVRQLGRALLGFPPAWRGLVHLVGTERHAQFHLVATVAVIALGWTLQIDRRDWQWLVVAIALVWMAEAMNSAVERLADRVTKAQDPLIGKAKDLAAGAVLVAAVAAAVTGALVFWPYLNLA